MIPPLFAAALLFLLVAAPATAQPTPEEPPVSLSSAAASVPLPPPATASGGPLAVKARALYFSGDSLTSALAFEAAVKASSQSSALWLDGAYAWADAGRPDKAVLWHKRASELSRLPEDRAEYAWALLRAARPEDADREFAAALAAVPDSPWALLGAGRAMLALGRAGEAADFLRRASEAAPGQNAAEFYLGQACERAGDANCASEAYRKAVVADSYLNEARGPLSRAYLRLKRYNDAWRQLNKLAEAEPSARLTRAMIQKVRPLLTASAEPRPAPTLAWAPAAASADTEAWGGKMPTIRVSVSSTGMGKPRARKSVTVRGSTAWRALDAKTGRQVVFAEAWQVWTARIVPAKGKKGKARLELRGPGGLVAAAPGDAVVLKPVDRERGTLSIEDSLINGQVLRGDLEIALYDRRRTLRLVNELGLEDYTHGVVSAEMPNKSPLEALKSQAVVARTHALFIMTVTRRHKKHGYDLCNEQHCQVYVGVRAETERTRAVVEQTRGRIVTYQGKPAHVIYSSNCGGRTQSGTDLGWGDVPYWKGVSDSVAPLAPPSSPTELRRFASAWPATAFCRPSGYVHAAHSRWTRVVPAKELEEKLARKLKIGKLRELRVLRRAASGNVNGLLVVGSKRSARLRDEMAIRSLLGVGSLRSTFFVVEPEYRREAPAKPSGKKGVKAEGALVPEAFVFRGGGWGHAIGLCQSGAMGRAEAGQSYEEIVRAYFAGVDLGQLGY